MFRPTVVVGGRVVGTWQCTGRGAQRTLTATPFTPLPAAVTERIRQAAARLPQSRDGVEEVAPDALV
jgi:hypothetical protein